TKPLGSRRNEPCAPLSASPQTVPSCGPPRSLNFTASAGMPSDCEAVGSCASRGSAAHTSPSAARIDTFLDIDICVFRGVARTEGADGSMPPLQISFKSIGAMMIIGKNDLRKLDLNLLVAFQVLVREKSVSRAAERLFLGQPAMSGA